MQDLHFTGRHFLCVSFITILNTQNSTVITVLPQYAQNMTALQPSIFLTGIGRLLVTKRDGRIPQRKIYQGQLKTLQTVSVAVLYLQYKTVKIMTYGHSGSFDVSLIEVNRLII